LSVPSRISHISDGRAIFTFRCSSVIIGQPPFFVLARAREFRSKLFPVPPVAVSIFQADAGWSLLWVRRRLTEAGKVDPFCGQPNPVIWSEEFRRTFLLNISHFIHSGGAPFYYLDL
jgi:hypothetical protein